VSARSLWFGGLASERRFIVHRRHPVDFIPRQLARPACIVPGPTPSGRAASCGYSTYSLLRTRGRKTCPTLCLSWSTRRQVASTKSTRRARGARDAIGAWDCRPSVVARASNAVSNPDRAQHAMLARICNALASVCKELRFPLIEMCCIGSLACAWRPWPCARGQ
jgi:hypothetical protein